MDNMGTFIIRESHQQQVAKICVQSVGSWYFQLRLPKQHCSTGLFPVLRCLLSTAHLDQGGLKSEPLTQVETMTMHHDPILKLLATKILLHTPSVVLQSH